MTLLLAGKINDDGQNVEVTLLHNPANAAVLSVEETVTTGEFLVTIDKNIMQQTAPQRWYIANNQGKKYCVSVNVSNQFIIAQFDQNGDNERGVCMNHPFEIYTY